MLRDLDEDADFDAGDILVCEFTGPSWMMLINLAGAMVIDVGGALSHGAIVARELGIPTVINTVDGTRRLRTGDTLRVDAAAGTVELLNRSPRVRRDGAFRSLVPCVRSLLPISGAQMAPRGVVVAADTTTVSTTPPPCDASIWITGYLARTSDARH